MMGKLCRFLTLYLASSAHFYREKTQGPTVYRSLFLKEQGGEQCIFSHRAHEHRDGSIQPPRSQSGSFAQGWEHSATEIPETLICTGRGAFSHRAHKPLAIDLMGKGTGSFSHRAQEHRDRIIQPSSS